MRVSSFLAIALLAWSVTDVTAIKLRVGCRAGYPPFNDLDADGNCIGLMYDAFLLVAAQYNITYDTIVPIRTSGIDQYLQLAPNGTSQLDIVINYHTVTPGRLALYNFAAQLGQTDEAIAIAPKYKASSGGLASTVVKDSVMYIFGVISLLFMFMAIVFLIFEHLHEGSELTELPIWRRPLWALEMGVEVVFTGSTTGALSSQISRSLRAIGACMAVFLVAIFGAVITSQLTVATVSVATTRISSVRGTRIAINSGTLQNYLQNIAGVTTVTVPDLTIFAGDFYAGKHPDIDGYSTFTDAVNYLHNLYGAAGMGYAVTESYFATGTYGVRSYAISFAAPNGTVDAMNAGITNIRENGQLASLLANYVVPADTGVTGDLAVPQQAFDALKAVVGVGCGIAFVMAFVFFIIAKRRGAEHDDFEDPVLLFEGRRYTGFSEAHAAVLDAISDYVAAHDNDVEGIRKHTKAANE